MNTPRVSITVVDPDGRTHRVSAPAKTMADVLDLFTAAAHAFTKLPPDATVALVQPKTPNPPKWNPHHN